MTRTVWYVSGTRADYGLMRETLRAIAQHDNLHLGILATGMHLDPAYGETVREIDSDGFNIVAKVASGEQVTTGGAMARGIGKMIGGFVDAMERGKPDLVLLLGDRGEMLAGAIAAIHLDIPVVHIHGGERSGTVDEPVRHAVSKLSHYHFTATQSSRERLCRMGERPEAVFTVGAPGLVGLSAAATRSRDEMAETLNFDPARPIALFIYHPVLQEAEAGGVIAAGVLAALRRRGYQTIALQPNSDSGSQHIRAVLEACDGSPDLRIVTHLVRDAFVNWMAVADVMIGNSSAGIIEAASFGTPVINIGMRQNLRERNANVLDISSDVVEIEGALERVARKARRLPDNIYGDGASDVRIAQLLATLPIDNATWKCNVY